MSTDFIANYFTARVEREQATDLTTRGKAERKARSIYNRADKAGILIPAGIDDAARVQVHGLTDGEHKAGIAGYDAHTGRTVYA